MQLPLSHEFQLIKNTFQSQDLLVLKDLIKLKCLYSKQLSKMPREYLIKLLFDTYHQSLIIKIDNKIIAGLTFRSFDHQPFCEIAFVAVNQQKKFKGFGSLLMNKFKTLTQQKNIKHIFTFADDGAIGFFEKHGFSKNITLPKQSYQPYVKQYIGGKLMECKLESQMMIDFENLNDSLEENKQQLIKKVKSLIGLAPYTIQKSSIIISKFDKKQFLIEELIEYIPGLKEVNSGKEVKFQDQRKLTLNFLLYCQNFIELASNKINLLKENIDQCSQRKTIDQKQLKRRKQILYSYRFLLHQMQIQLLHGNFKYKDQFIKYLNDKINLFLGPEDKLKGKEKEFSTKMKQLCYDFMKNQLSFQSIDKKYKLQNHPKI